VKPDVLEDLGSENHLIFTIDAPRVSADAVRAATETQGDDEGKLFADEGAVFTAVLDARRPVQPNAEIELALDPETFYFFDPGTGLSLDTGRRSSALTTA
jgi:multiple sugar transport system ATP-binding protein